jgi:tetratricopeptide (TPR) repeat protein
MQKISEAMGYSGKVTNAKFSRPDDTAAPFHIEYEYEREKSGDWDTLRIIPQLAPIGLADADEKDPPVSPIQIGQPHVEISHAAMKLPPGWSAELPPAIHAHTAFATLDKTYKFENGTLTTDRRFEVLADKIPAADWKTYHQWFKDAGLDGETFVQLTGSSDGKTSTTPPVRTDNNPEAADLARQSLQAVNRKDWTTAKKKLDEAEAINSHQPYLWSQYGFIAANTGHMDEAIADYRKELADHPEESNLYQYLAFLLLQQKKTDEAITVLRSEFDLNPSNESNTLELASLLDGRSDRAAAEKVLRAALLASPNSANIKVQLGFNLIHQHKQDEGEPILRDVISTSDDPGQLNNAAYELADASLDLPLAEKAARRSLELLDKLSTNGETGPAALRRADLIPSVWDTFGWILFREDKIAEAEPWIRAAWRNGNSAEAGYHLGIILDREQKPAEALAQLQLASAGAQGTNAADVQKLIDSKVAELQKSTTTSTGTKGLRMRLQDQRTYRLPRGKLTPKGHGWATIELDVTAKGTTAVRFVQGDETLEPLFPAVRDLDLDLDIPPASQASLLRRGILSCSTMPTCDLILVSPQDAMNQP